MFVCFVILKQSVQDLAFTDYFKSLIILSHLVRLTMSMSQFQTVYESLLIDYESMKRKERDKVRENLEAEQKRRRRRRKVGRLGCSPTLFVPSTLLLCLCPRSAVPSSRESAGRTTPVRNFTKQGRNPVISHQLVSATSPTLIAF